MLVMVAVAVMHEQVHQRTGQQEQVGQNTQDVRSMLSQQQKYGRSKKAKEYKTPSGKMLCFVWIRHGNLLKVQHGVAATQGKSRS